MIKQIINQLGAFTVKHHWLILLIIFGLQWWTGENMKIRWARQLHDLNGKLVLTALIYMAANKLWLELKRKGKI